MKAERVQALQGVGLAHDALEAAAAVCALLAAVVGGERGTARRRGGHWGGGDGGGARCREQRAGEAVEAGGEYGDLGGGEVGDDGAPDELEEGLLGDGVVLVLDDGHVVEHLVQLGDGEAVAEGVDETAELCDLQMARRRVVVDLEDEVVVRLLARRQLHLVVAPLQKLLIDHGREGRGPRSAVDPRDGRCVRRAQVEPRLQRGLVLLCQSARLALPAECLRGRRGKA
mmetsp:Transcript_27793/g.81336  ORF Transcript_27793/g.81336 Transcript_27793/m.81336 type:complete len:228 (+) Transcript_27793:179-862(+)